MYICNCNEVYRHFKTKNIALDFDGKLEILSDTTKNVYTIYIWKNKSPVMRNTFGLLHHVYKQSKYGWQNLMDKIFRNIK